MLKCVCVCSEVTFHTYKVNQTLYRSMIGKLQYVVHDRPDIALAICIVARFFANPKENHLMAVKG